MNDKDTKEKIVEAAMKCFSVRGLHQTKISDIVREAGLAQGTFYLYFKSKEALFRSIMEDYIAHTEQLLERERRRLPAFGAGNPETMKRFLKNLYAELLADYRRKKAVHTIICLSGTNSPGVKEVRRVFKQRMSRIIIDYLQGFPVAGQFTFMQLEMLAVGIMGMFESIAEEWFIERDAGENGRYGMEETGKRDEILDSMAEVLSQTTFLLLASGNCSGLRQDRGKSD